MTEPFDLDARLKQLTYHDGVGVVAMSDSPYLRAAIKQLIRDVLRAVKPANPALPDEVHCTCLPKYIDELEANITNLLGDK